MVQIRDIQTTVIAVPVTRRIVSSVRDTDRVINVLVEVLTDEEISGLSYIAAFTRHKAQAVCALVDDLAEVVRGMDAAATGMVWERMWAACTLIGHSGLAVFALSAIDTALWDLQGKLLNVPVHRLLGTRRTSLPAYASDGCWLYPDPGQVADEAIEFAGMGFKAVKIRFGRPDPEQDIVALDSVRRTVGDEIDIMVDVNQGWSRTRALEYGRRLAEYNVTWLEEPLVAEDIDGLAEVRSTLSIPIVAGENAYMPAGISALVDVDAVSMVMPDLQRVGGINGWVRANAIAQSRHIPITAHLFPEISAHLLAASDLAGPLEWITWMDPVLETPLLINQGQAEVPNGPGLGLAFQKDAVEQYRIL